MRRLAAATAVAGMLAFAPAASAQGLDVGATCHALLGSGQTNLGVATLDRCLTATADKCGKENELTLLNLVRIRATTVCVASRTVVVGGVAKLRLFP